MDSETPQPPLPPPAAADHRREQGQEQHQQQQQQQQQQDASTDEEGGGGAADDGDCIENLVSKAQGLMEKITSSQDNPNPFDLHALSSILETQESRYMEVSGHSSLNNGRASHDIGRLGNLIREYDEFFDLISSKFISETRYSISVHAAAARLLLSCSLTWMYPLVFEDTVVEKIKNWVMDETVCLGNYCNLKCDSGGVNLFDFEMLRTYSTGLFALCLAGGGPAVEDALTSGLSAKFMRYLRSCVFGESGQNQLATSYLGDKNKLGVSSLGDKDGRIRVQSVLEATNVDGSRMLTEESVADRSFERNPERKTVDGMDVRVDAYDLDVGGEDKWHGQELDDGKINLGDFDETSWLDSRRRATQGLVRSKGKRLVTEAVKETELALNIPGSGCPLFHGQITEDKSLPNNPDAKEIPDATCSGRSKAERNNSDDLFQEFKIGTMDISNLIKKAVLAAEAEARAANAPVEAIKAAGDAAAELVKSAALEEFQTSKDEETVLLAASRAASTVIDAAADIAVSRSSSGIIADSANSKSMEPEMNADGDYFLPDGDSLAQLRQKYCIQCLEILSEYVEVLGPVLHEKGVDVCLALLQETSKPHEILKVEMILPDVLKLICVLATHRKFAALFVDRGGIQKLLTIPRVLQTFFGLSSCLYTIGSLQGIMERVCALPSDVVHQVVKLALQLLECSQDQARKNAALFFAAAFVFRAVIDSFDSQNGLKKILDLLHDAASVRSGISSGTLGLSTSGSHRDRSPAEVLTSSEKLIAYHTCVALRQYFRAHLILLVDSIRPSKNSRSAFRTIPCVRAAYKPLDISNEALDAVFLQLQKDRKLGPAFVRARWPAVDNFLASNGHSTMLELCQAPPVERYLRDLLQYALGVLHIVTLVPHCRKLLVSCTLSNDRVGIAVILDAANSAGCVDPDIIQPALNVFVNLVCPPPSISNKPPLPQGQKSVTGQTSNVRAGETRERNAERTIPDRVVSVSAQSDSLERNGESSSADRGSTVVLGQPPLSTVSQTHVPTVTSGLVGDRRISLGVGAGSAGLAAQLEQGYRQAREAVRANNGIKVLLHLLQPRIVSPPATLDCLRALACRVLLGLARDDTIAHILTKLQVGKRLSELIRDSGNQTPGNEQGRWQSELAQVAIELIAIVTNTGRASRLAATDAATPALRRIERAAIAAATPITYHSRELLLLIHEHLQASGLAATAAALLEEAQLTPLPSLAAPLSLAHHASVQENPTAQLHWPSGRSTCGFFSNKLKLTLQNNDSSVMKCDSDLSSSWKKPLVFSSSLNLNSKNQSQSLEFHTPIISKVLSSNKSFMPLFPEVSSASLLKPNVDMESQCKTPILLPMKRKSTETKDAGFTSSGKRLNIGEHVFRSPGCFVPSVVRKGTIAGDATGFCSPMPREQCGRSMPGSVLTDSLDDNQYSASATHACQLTPASQLGLQNELYSSNSERLTLDSLVVQYLKHQHRQCTAPITTLPPLSLLHPHICPEPKRSLDAPSNVTSRLSAREFRGIYGGRHGNRRDRQFVYSRFRPWRTCRDDAVLLTCLTFLGNSSHIAAGSHSGELKIFDSDSNDVLESCTSHQSPLTLVQSCLVGETQLVLSSSSHDVRLWDASLISSGPLHSFQGCKSARFSNSGNIFAALPFEQAHREIFLYDIQTCNLESKLSDTSPSTSGLESGGANSLVHFSPSDIMLLWNGVLWDRRSAGPVHRFDQFTDFGGGGFHPAGNEVIINSEVWDLRKFRLLRSVPSLDQTNITFNARGDVLYAILRRNLEDITSAVHTRRAKHALFSAFRTLDAVNYSDIATTSVDRCVLDFTNDSTDSFVGLVTMDDQEQMYSSARVYEIGRRRPTDDDSDPDDAESEEGDEEDDEDSVGDPILGTGFGGDGDSDDVDDMSNDDDSLSDLDDDEDDEDEGGGRILELLDESDDDSGLAESFSSGDEDEFAGAGFAF